MSDDSRDFREEMRQSAHRVWLAGLGAVAVAEEQGSKVFRRLVETGAEYSARRREELRRQLEELRTRWREESAPGHGGDGAWARLERRLEEAMERLMRSSGLPTADEVEALRAHIEELSRQVEAMRARREASARSDRESRVGG